MIPENNPKLLIGIEARNHFQQKHTIKKKKCAGVSDKTIALSIQLQFQQRRASFIQITI